ncbi:MAG: hypothetical protein JRN52_10750 [Nitrososphaerota archaeon]|nr:hypothetical protein [Nitrososphaerota archaeon]
MKSLVAYGMRYGSTSKIASFIATVLREEHIDVEVVELTNKERPSFDLSEYDLIIVGKNNCKQEGRVLRVVLDCSRTRQETAGEDRLSGESDKPLPLISPIALDLFGGYFDFSGNHGFLYRITLKSFKKQLEREGVDTSKPYDFRDWEAIEDWTRSVAAYVLAHSVTT